MKAVHPLGWEKERPCLNTSLRTNGFAERSRRRDSSPVSKHWRPAFTRKDTPKRPCASMTKLRFTSLTGWPNEALIHRKLMQLTSRISCHTIFPHAVVHLAVSDKIRPFVQAFGTLMLFSAVLALESRIRRKSQML